MLRSWHGSYSKCCSNMTVLHTTPFGSQSAAERSANGWSVDVYMRLLESMVNSGSRREPSASIRYPKQLPLDRAHRVDDGDDGLERFQQAREPLCSSSEGRTNRSATERRADVGTMPSIVTQSPKPRLATTSASGPPPMSWARTVMPSALTHTR
jgi:hypothetical protein